MQYNTVMTCSDSSQSHALYFRKLESLGYIFVADSIGLASFV